MQQSIFSWSQMNYIRDEAESCKHHHLIGMVQMSQYR